jgi:phosphopantothenoylcysteine decarboxylase/phosphopantothenate--cysteine ligase
VSGGIAIYKACSIVRRLAEAGAVVDVVLTESAAEFIRPVTFEALSGRPVLTSLWQRGQALAHIELGRNSDLIILAPATANLLARAAQGIADDLLTTTLLAAEVPVLAAPAMNDSMFAHPATQANIAVLEERGWVFVGPAIGDLAEGPSSRPGRMVEPEEIVAYAERLLRGATSSFRDKRVVVTAGATREKIDPVRVVTNPSSGKMGFAVATAAFARGADVTLITGPTELAEPSGVDVIRVESTEELLRATESALAGASVLVMAAAPADYRPRESATEKLPRTDGALQIWLDPTPDVLTATRAQWGDRMVAVGFALESGEGTDRARQKLVQKGLDLIVLNRVGVAGAGFETDTNQVSFITGRTTATLPLLPKREVAERLLDEVEGLL